MAKSTERLWGAAAWLAVAMAMGIHGACNGRVTVSSGGSGGTGGGGAGGNPTTGGAGGSKTASSSSSSSSSGGTGGSKTTSVTTSSVVTTTTTGGGPVPVAAQCASNADCGMAGHCVLPTDDDALFGGGAPGGYCTLKCLTDSDCGGGTCLLSPNGEFGECALSCFFGEPEVKFLNDPLDPDKCRGREDLRCQELPDGSSVCLPTCGVDVQCDGGFCDPRTAVCVKKQPMGDPVGTKCDPMSMAETCAGTCIALANGKSMCSGPCTMAGEVPNELECGGSKVGVCLFSPAGTGAGDVGYCAQSCSVQDQCQTPDFFCFNIGLRDFGTCLDSDPCTKDSDCPDLPDSACVATKEGKFCMSANYPLGTLAP